MEKMVSMFKESNMIETNFYNYKDVIYILNDTSTKRGRSRMVESGFLIDVLKETSRNI